MVDDESLPLALDGLPYYSFFIMHLFLYLFFHFFFLPDTSSNILAPEPHKQS